MRNPQDVVLTTAAVGREVGYSTQQVRDLEHMGVIPPAARGSNGYRRYDDSHVIALHAYRALAAAINPVRARRLMPVLLRSSIDEVAECIDDLHAEVARDRARVREALRGLDAVIADDAGVFDESDTMTIGELADALGVRTSALRHWEAEGLIVPDRVDGSRARRYRARAITEARIVAALRAGGYPLPPISEVLIQLSDARSDDSSPRSAPSAALRLDSPQRRPIGWRRTPAHACHVSIVEQLTLRNFAPPWSPDCRFSQSLSPKDQPTRCGEHPTPVRSPPLVWNP